MANENQVLDMQLFFPFKGINEAFAYKDQVPLSTPIIANCRIKDVSENRSRGGQREGLKKAFTEQVGSDRPVIKIVPIVNTYIRPE